MAEIREASIDDLVPILILIEEMVGRSTYAGLPFDPRIAGETVVMCVRREDGLALVVEDEGIRGFLLAQIEESWFGPARMASDYMAYVTPSAEGFAHSYRMHRRYVDWARARGADVITTTNISDMDDDRWQRICRRMGYTRSGGVMQQRRDSDGRQKQQQ